MGFLLALLILAISAGIVFLWGVSKVIIIILGVLWVSGFILTFIFGHRGFKSGSNTDLMLFIFVFGISFAISVPHLRDYNQKMFCGQAKQALVEVSDAETIYFTKQKAFAKEMKALNVNENQEVKVLIISADEKSFVATASHSGCDMDRNNVPDQFIWDSAKGGLQ